MISSNDTKTLNIGEAAKYCGLSIPTFRGVMEQIPHRKVGRRYLFLKDALDKWLQGVDE